MGKIPQQKGRRKVVIFRAIAIFFLVIEFLGLAGGSTSEGPKGAGGGAIIGYYIGYNFPLLLALLFFYLSYRAQKKLKKGLVAQQLDFIGKNE